MTDEPKKTPVKLTREELYRQVWSAPMQRLAAQYGVSGNGLAKICDRLAIPYPPRGYWNKKAAGKNVRQIELPPAKAGTPNEATITPTPPKLPPPEMPSELREAYDKALSDAAEIAVPAVLRRPHPVIAGWQAENARSSAFSRLGQGARRSPAPKLSALDSRRYRFLDALFKALEERGFKGKSDGYWSVWVESGRERIEFTLTEHIKQIKRRLNEEERRSPFHRGQEWRQDRVPTGRLVFTIKTWLGDRIPCRWMDEDEAPLEQQIGKIVAAFIVAVPWLVEKRRLDEQRERERWEEQRKRDQEASERKREDNRWRCFLKLAKQWREAETARQFLAALEAMPSTGEAVGGRSLEEWAAWTRSQLKIHDPLEYAVETVWNTVAVVTAWDVEK